MITKENKPSTPRTKRLRENYMRTKPTICSERAVLITDSYIQTEGMPPVLRQAMAFDKFLSEVTIYIQDGELLVGNMASRPLGTSIFPEYDYTWIEKELDTISTRESDPYILSDEDKKKLKEAFKYWPGRTFKTMVEAYLPEECKRARATGAFDCEHLKIGSDGHLTPGHDQVLTKGFNGIIKEAEDHLDSLDLSKPEDYEKWHFLKAVIIADKAVIKFAKRYADLAREKAANEKDATRKAELIKIAEVCDRVPANPARNFWEGLQVVIFTMLTVQMESNGHSISAGRLDQYMYPYYKKDIDEGGVTKDQAIELLECLWLKLADTFKAFEEANSKYFRGYQNYQQITVGGLTREGEDATNELSYLMLDVTGNLKLSKPTISARVHKKTPEEFLMKCLEITKIHKGGMPALYNDEVVIQGMLTYARELTRKDVFDWTVVGCVEHDVMGMGFSPANNSAFINDAKILEMALYGGKDPLTGIKIGPQDGGMTTWKSYEEMIDAIVKRTHYHNKLFSEELNVIHLVRRLTFPTPYLSSMIKDCVKRGSSIIDHGAIYSPGGLGNYLGVANVGNSIAAIKKLVFEDKLFTLEQLKHALETNYEDTTTTPTGSEIQQRCLAVPKYGNDNDYVDKIVKDVLNMQADSMHQFRCLYGNIRSAGVIPVTAHIPFGVVTHATPDGRKSGTPLAEGCSPTQGTDVRGPTAAVRSVAKIDHVNLDAGTLYNLKLNPQSVEDESGMRKWMNLIRTYFDLGGHHIQFNVVTADTLRAAQKQPEKYRDLLIRVAGYSAFFVTMDKALQDDIIARTEHVL